MSNYFKRINDLKLEKLNDIRINELHNVISNLPNNSKELEFIEIGSGTGIQLNFLKNFFKNIVGIEIHESNYNQQVKDNIVYYNGSTIPFEDSSFDIVFSSHVMEHISNFSEFDKEIKRILKPSGICIHVLPNSFWKFYNTLFHYPFIFKTISEYFVRKYSEVGLTRRGTVTLHKRSIITLIFNVLMPPLHGENGNRFTEIFYMTSKFWKKRFQMYNWEIERIIDSDYFVSGHLFLPNNLRYRFSKILGSTSTIFIVRKRNQ